MLKSLLVALTIKTKLKSDHSIVVIVQDEKAIGGKKNGALSRCRGPRVHTRLLNGMDAEASWIDGVIYTLLITTLPYGLARSFALASEVR